MPETAQIVVLAKALDGAPKESNFRIETRTLPDLKENQVLFKSLYISPDPYQRGQMDSTKEGEVIGGSCVAEVIKSTHKDFKSGDLIVPYKGWVSHGILNADELKTVLRHDPNLGPTSTALGVLGMPGMTAYLGLKNVLKPKEGETLIVSGAAGAVGSLVGQIGKIWGLKVIGTAGSDEKCKYLKSLGFDHTINYKGKSAKQLESDIKSFAPDGIDCFFDNVGSEILDAVLNSLKQGARIALCGQISQYNSLGEPKQGPRLFWNLIYTNAKIEGFVSLQWASEWPAGIKQVGQWIKEGKIKYQETIDEGGIEATPKAFISMLSGGNTGKQLVKLTK